jgi:hypothetical protein
MSYQIIILNSSTQPDGSFYVVGVFWLTANSNNIVPQPNFVSSVPFIDTANLALLQSGVLIEQAFNSGLFTPGTILTSVQSTLQTLFITAQSNLNSFNPPLSNLIGNVYNGSSWSTTNVFIGVNSHNPNIVPQLTQVVLSNTTITTGSSQIFTGYSNRQVNLFINIKNSPTGTSPGLQFTIQELDPGDLTTVVGTSTTGLSLTSGPTTQELTLNLTTSSVIKVSWIIVGTTPSFTGVYATLVSKPTTVFSGVDVNGIERVFQPDSSGRLLVSGSNAVGSAATVNPILIGGVNPGGVAGYNQLSSDDSMITVDGPNTQPVIINATINSNSISNLTNIGDGTVYLFINVKNAPTGTTPTLTFSMYEVDPGDRSTVVRGIITGMAIKAAGTQVLTLPMVSSGIVQVSWTVGGTSPSFTGVYATAICKNGVTPADVYGDLYSSTINSLVYEATTATTGVAPGTVIGTTGAYTLYNPKTSTRNLVVLSMRMGYISGTLGSGTVYLTANNNPSASAPTGTAITTTSALIGGTGTSQAQAFTSSTLPVSPTIIKPLWVLTPMLATSVFQPFMLEEETEGKYIITPGCALSLEAVAGVGSSPKVVFAMTWIEVPF